MNGPGLTASYGYDPLGDLIAQTVNGAVTSYQVDPAGLETSSPALALVARLTAHFTYGLGLVSQVSAPGTASYYDFNNVGSTVGMSGASGAYTNVYAYLPFGQTLTVVASVSNPFTFVAQTGVMNEGNGLYDMRIRTYDSVTGYFTQPDPLNIDGGNTNVRVYGDNNPISEIDPAGLESLLGYYNKFSDAGDVYKFLTGDCEQKFEAGGSLLGGQLGEHLGEGLAVVVTTTEVYESVVLEVGSLGTLTPVVVLVDVVVTKTVWTGFGDLGSWAGGKLGGWAGGLLGSWICKCLPPEAPPPPGGPCTLAIGIGGYYICDNIQVGIGAVAAINVPGILCTGAAVEGAIAGFGGGGLGLRLALDSRSIATPCSISWASRPRRRGCGRSAGQHDAPGDGHGPGRAAARALRLGMICHSCSLRPLGNLGLINGQTGNDGYTAALADQMSSTIATFDQVEDDLAGIFQTAAARAAALALAVTSPFCKRSTTTSRLSQMPRTCSSAVMRIGLIRVESAVLQQWMTDFFTDAGDSTDGGQIARPKRPSYSLRRCPARSR